MLPDPTDPSKVVQSALGGIREALKAGKDIQETAKEVNAFLDAEAKARVSFRRKQQEVQRRGDMMYIDAINEYRVLRNIRVQKERAFKQLEREFGRKAIQEVEQLEVRLRKEKKELQREFDSDRKQTRNEWLALGMAALVVYGILKAMRVW
jgi:hypothetical protein